MARRAARVTFLACILTVAISIAASAFAGHAWAAESPPKLSIDEATAIMARVEADGSIAAMVKLCPADAFARLRKAPSLPISEEIYCRHKRAACLESCLANEGADYCVSLALFLSDHEDAVTPITELSLFALGCAQGYASGCTNRASIIRNTHTKGDPFAAAPEPVKARCEYRSFTLACDESDSWGCAMAGQSLELGEGTERDLTLARNAYQKACALSAGAGSPHFAACTFARRHLERLDPPKKSAEPGSEH